MDEAAHGNAALEAGNNSEAIELYTAALKKTPTAPDYYTKRSTAYQRCSPPDYESALRDAEVGVMLATKRAKRELILQAQLRRAIALYGVGKYADAGFVLGFVKKLDPKEKTLPIWEMKINRKLEELPADDENKVPTAKEVPEVEVPTFDASPKNDGGKAELAPAKVEEQPPTEAAKTTPSEPVPQKVKQDWYQSGDKVYFSLLVKGVNKEHVTVEIEERSLSVSFPTNTGNTFDLTLDPLYGAVKLDESTHNVTPSKIEIILKKASPGKWNAMEGNPTTTPTTSVNPETSTPTSTGPSYPTSSRSGPKNWDKMFADSGKKKNSGEEGDDDYYGSDEEGDPANAFFKKLYKNADPDTQRAMMKSYQESNGTSLSTDWSSVSKGKVETQPPDGMVAKKWGE